MECECLQAPKSTHESTEGNDRKRAKEIVKETRIRVEKSVVRELHTSLRDSWRGGEFQSFRPMIRIYFAHCSQLLYELSGC